MQNTESEVKGGRTAARNITITAAAADLNAKNHKWALDSRNRWSSLAERLEIKLDVALKALDEIASRPDGFVMGENDLTLAEIAATAIIAIEKAGEQ
jgi:hypothetical protein